eukprot:GFKZ01007574.1.p2 GENE.GFKZ01007574.1~~GFKZ01007574.1.p2  ORF type:complete len:257 (+),score=57.22 GFKZ01007574.1:361-1131(+)
MTASPTTAAEVDDDSDDFVVQTITAQDGSVQDPKSLLNLTTEHKRAGLGDYGDVESSSSDSDSDSNSEESIGIAPSKEKVPAAIRHDKTEKPDISKKRKRVRFANDTTDPDPPKGAREVQIVGQLEGAGEDGLDEEMAAFEAEVRVLDGGREEADVDLAEIEDEREQALEEELRTRVINMRKRLRGTESKESAEAAVKLTDQNLRLQLREKRYKSAHEHATADVVDDDDDDDDDNIDLIADWTRISGGKNIRGPSE